MGEPNVQYEQEERLHQVKPVSMHTQCWHLTIFSKFKLVNLSFSLVHGGNKQIKGKTITFVLFPKASPPLTPIITESVESKL